MSGALSDLFNSLFEASWRGIEFHMADPKHEVGRRVERSFFPGKDTTAHEDLGALDGSISVNGLIIGEDYVRRARALEAAFRQPGPGTLVHPWIGELQVVLAKAAQIRFNDQELRVARFEAVFEPWNERDPAPQDTLGKLLAQVDAVKAQVRGLLRQALAPLMLPLAAISAVQGYADAARSTWSGLLAGGRGAGAILAALPTTAFSGLSGVGGLAIDSGWADEVTDRLDAVPAGISAAAAPIDVPMVSPAAEATVAALPIDARAATELLLAAAPGLALTLLDPAPGPALALAGQAQAMAAAVATASGIPFESRQDAVAWRIRIDGALGRLAGDAAAVTAASIGGSGGPGALWRGVTDLRAAWARDMNDRIGRLPSVERFTPPGPVPLWLVAQHIAGGDPSRVIAQYQDLVARNRLRHPAVLAPGQVLEVLRR